MQNLLVVGLFLIIVVLYMDVGVSFKCYQCRSDVNDECSNNVNISWSKECPPKSTGKGNDTNSGKNATIYCRKIRQKLNFKDEKSWTIIRECAYEYTGRACYHYHWLEIANQRTCECKDEACNYGRSNFPEILTLVLTAFTWILNYLKTDKI